MIAAISLPRVMRIGAGAIGELAAVLEYLGLCRPLIVTDQHLMANGPVKDICASLTGAGVPVRIFSDAVADPTVASLKAGLLFLRGAVHDCVVGIGGGSVLDTAKALAVWMIYGGEIGEYRVPHVQNAPGLPIIAIPTTAGTGSEVTRFTVITDEASNEKMLCAGLGFLPTAAIVDYELTLSMPHDLTAATGIDALTHALEAYVSARANPFSDGMALMAIAAVGPNLRRVIADPRDRTAREAMMWGATQAGAAFSNSSVALIHGMSRPISAFFHVPHGVANAMLLPLVTAYSGIAAPSRYAVCARAMGVASADDSDETALARLCAELRDLNEVLGVPTPKGYGIDAGRWRETIGAMAEQALASGSPANNPRVPTCAEVEELYRRAWSGEARG